MDTAPIMAHPLLRTESTMRVTLTNVNNATTHAQVFHVTYGTPDAVVGDGDLLTRDGLPLRWEASFYTTIEAAIESAVESAEFNRALGDSLVWIGTTQALINGDYVTDGEVIAEMRHVAQELADASHPHRDDTGATLYLYVGTVFGDDVPFGYYLAEVTREQPTLRRFASEALARFAMARTVASWDTLA